MTAGRTISPRRRTLTAVALLGLALAPAGAGPDFESALLRWMYEELRLDLASARTEPAADGSAGAREARVRGRLGGRTVLVRVGFDAGGRVAHVGWPLFTGEELRALQPVGRFLERHLLVYALEDGPPAAGFAADGLDVRRDGAGFGTDGFASIEDVLDLIRRRASASVTVVQPGDAGRFVFTCRDSAGAELRIDVPARLDLISGKDQAELELDLQQALRSEPVELPDAEPSFEGTPAVRYARGVFRTEGRARFPGIRDDVFLVREDLRFRLLRDPARYPVETLQNHLLHPPRTPATTLRLVHERYGRVRDTIDVGLARLVALMRREHDAFVGFERGTGRGPDRRSGASDTLVATVVFAHRTYAYQHVMVVVVPPEARSLAEPVRLEARLHGFVRGDNVERLMAGYREGAGRGIPVRRH